MENTKLFWNASLEELKAGYIGENQYYTCLLCGETIEKGIVYPEDGILYEAERYMKLHIENRHKSVFDFILDMDKKFTGVTEHQKTLLKLFHEGKSDSEVQKEMNIGSGSTVRNHRFILKEKERQAKLFLAIMELLKEKDEHAPKVVNPHITASMVDDRYNITAKERDAVLKKYFAGNVLKTFEIKEKYKVIVLNEIAKRFDRRTIYTEKQINEILKAIYDDHVLLRRYLVEYGFLDRKADGSEYWVL